jgi:hypothetical protein
MPAPLTQPFPPTMKPLAEKAFSGVRNCAGSQPEHHAQASGFRVGMRLAQFLGAFLAAHLDDVPADRDLDGIRIECVIARGAGFLVHDFLQ